MKNPGFQIKAENFNIKVTVSIKKMVKKSFFNILVNSTTLEFCYRISGWTVDCGTFTRWTVHLFYDTFKINYQGNNE